ncbi:MAG: hypothetical protein JWR19_2186 [Pedosphaera sp.]|nr:hypothetical protein [Pedosphaera sp.]
MFGPAPVECPHGSVRLSLSGWGSNAGDLMGVEAVGVYLERFNRAPIRYHVVSGVALVKLKPFEGRAVKAEDFNELQKQQAIELITHK